MRRIICVQYLIYRVMEITISLLINPWLITSSLCATCYCLDVLILVRRNINLYLQINYVIYMLERDKDIFFKSPWFLSKINLTIIWSEKKFWPTCFPTGLCRHLFFSKYKFNLFTYLDDYCPIWILSHFSGLLLHFALVLAYVSIIRGGKITTRCF